MGHGHHHHVDPDAGDKRVFAAIAVNMGLTVAQVVGGIVSGSLALIADALHNFSDAVSLIIAFAARCIARRPRDEDMTFGYGRVEVVAALINYTTLIVIGLYLLYQAAVRLADPQPVAGWTIVIVAGIALIVDVVTAFLTYSMSKSSVNIRAAFLHNVADALGSGRGDRGRHADPALRLAPGRPDRHGPDRRLHPLAVGCVRSARSCAS